LMDLSDCKTCHAKEKKSIGPSWIDVSKKYKASVQNIDMLSKKIINGGGGVWGEQVMAAHPQISNSDAKEIVQYILSLGDTKKASKPIKGEYVTSDKGKPGTFIFAATYTDKGNGSIAPATGTKVVTLRDAHVAAINYDNSSKAMKMKVDGMGELLIATGDKGYAQFSSIDLTGIKSVKIFAAYLEGTTAGGKLELHTGSPTGPLAGSIEINASKQFDMPLSVSGVNDLYFVFVANPNSGDKPLYAIKEFYFN
jgi:cytochrome c